MTYKIDFINGKAIEWKKKNGETVKQENQDYRPRFYIEGDKEELKQKRPWVSAMKEVKATGFEEWKPTLNKERQEVLRVDTRIDDLKTVVNRIKKEVGRTRFRYYNVGFSPQFRYCIQEQICPTPEEKLGKIELKMSRKDLAEENLENLYINGKKSGKKPLKTLKNMVAEKDPEMIVVNRGQLLELLDRKTDELEDEFSLGKTSSLQKLAGENTVSSYGKTVHSNARYNIPGRIVIDRSNSFFLRDTTIEGLWDLVQRSYRPIQELAWGSIGRVLTSIEVRKAYLEEDTLTPWKNWNGESPKKASKMHKADRGGFIFNPEPSIHRDVYEADFASLFPNIMVKKNISPETVCCDCCDNEKTPELDYSICQEKSGFISEVLKPLVEDRQEMKDRLKEKDLSEEERKYFQGSVDAIKWLLVSCFGYMGHSHASYGAIKCHQAIQAFDREIMVKTKKLFEDSGYSIAHGIIDSIWVQKDDDAESFEEVCQDITDEIDIELEPEHRFEWVAFVPRSSQKGIGTLNRYFGKKEDGGFKTAGIETEQNSVSEYTSESQMKMIEALDKDMNPEDVLDVLERRIDRLRSSEVSPENLLRAKKTSKSLEQYSVENRTVAAIKRSRRHGIDIKPGQEVEFVVRDDEAPSLNRVRLGFEVEENDYDPEFYIEQLVRAAESVLSPLGMDHSDIKRRLSGYKSETLEVYT